ncbi:MAG: hypothetical protein JWN76_1698 [Chitinophagaceae bacterium]|nr:hypothetical protein [Chitinophagaceae bacterium]
MQKKFVIAVAFLCFTLMSYSFTNNDSLKAQMLKEWRRSKSYTNEYLNAMPADKYGFRPVDSIRSFSEQMLHLSNGNAFYGAISTGATAPSFGAGLEKRRGAQSKDSVMYFVNASYDFIISSLEKLDAAKLEERVKARGQDETRLTFLSKALEHQAHHRGQCTIYIRLQGIRPPNERLF